MHLLQENPKGFSTSHLYRELYHANPPDEKPYKPLLFDYSRHNAGSIWLRPQVQRSPPDSEENRRYLKLTLKFNVEPDITVMDELASQLQYLPHIGQIRFDYLSAPNEQIVELMRLTYLTEKLRPLIRKLRVRRRLRQVMALKHPEYAAEALFSLLKPRWAKADQTTYDWSSAIQDDSHRSFRESRDQETKLVTRPPSQVKSSWPPRSFDFAFDLSQDKEYHFDINPVDSPTGGLASGGGKEDIKSHTHTQLGDRKHQRSPTTDQKSSLEKRPRTSHELNRIAH